MLFSPVLGFWQFGSAAMLLWGLAAALPILIHLWNRQRHRTEPWAAMTFLVAALEKNARRLRLEQWLLLAIRTAIVLLFVAALADPRWIGPAAGNDPDSSAKSHTVLVLDGSYSMGFLENGRSRFDAARDLAKQFVAGNLDLMEFTVVMMSDPPRVPVAEPMADDAAVTHALDNMRLSHGGANLSATLSEIETILGRSSRRVPSYREQHVRVYSDLQAASWSAVTGPEVIARLQRLERLAKLELVDLGQPNQPNLALSELSVDRPLVTTRGEAQIRAEMENFGTLERPRQFVEFLVDGVRIAEERVDLPPAGRAVVAIKHRFHLPGDQIIEARLTDDALPLDNRRWLSIGVRDAVRVLCVGGRPGETRHLALALAPGNAATSEVQIVEILASRLLEQDLSEFDCVFVCNVGSFAPAEGTRLRRFVHGGGGLVIFLGEQVQAQNYNAILGPGSGESVLPAEIGMPVSSDELGIDPLDYRHPIIAPFDGFEQAGLLTTPIWKYLQLRPLDCANVVAGLTDGQPLIVESRLGTGRCILVATAASPLSRGQASGSEQPWNALSAWPSFPPLVHEMLHFSLRGQRDNRNVQIDELVSGMAEASAPDASLVVTGPGGFEQRLQIRESEGEAQWTFSTGQCGAYEVRGRELIQRIAVNIDSREGDLARIDPQSLPRQWRAAATDVAERSPEQSPNGVALLYRWLLGSLAMLLVAEPFLAWQFARRRA